MPSSTFRSLSRLHETILCSFSAGIGSNTIKIYRGFRQLQAEEKIQFNSMKLDMAAKHSDANRHDMTHRGEVKVALHSTISTSDIFRVFSSHILRKSIKIDNVKYEPTWQKVFFFLVRSFICPPRSKADCVKTHLIKFFFGLVSQAWKCRVSDSDCLIIFLCKFTLRRRGSSSADASASNLASHVRALELLRLNQRFFFEKFSI